MIGITSRRGIAYALASAVLFGASVPIAKLLLGNGVNGGLLAGLLYLGSGLGLAGVIGIRRLLRIRTAETPLRLADVPRLVLVTAVGGIGAPLLLMWGLARTDAASASLLLNVESVATLVVAWLVFRENADWRIVLGAAAIVAGAVLVSWSGASAFNWGSAAIIAACTAWAIDNNVTRSLSGSDPIAIATWKGLTAGAFNVVLALTYGARLPEGSLVATAGVVGLMSYGASLVLFVLALRHLGVARTGAYYSTAPFIGALLAVVLFADPITANLVWAGGLMAFGVVLHILEVHAHWHAHELVDHEHRHSHDMHHNHHSGNEPGEEHTHSHRHEPVVHSHHHYPDLHHRHVHASDDGPVRDNAKPDSSGSYRP